MAGPIMSDWSNLPYDIIHKVSKCLIAIEDFLAFSAVCRSWRSVYLAKEWHPGPQIPLLMCSDYDNSSIKNFMSFIRNKGYNSELPEAHGRRCWGTSSGWILMIGEDLKISLLNPFTHVSIGLPPRSSLQIYFVEILDWHDIIKKAFVFRKPCTSEPNEEDMVVMIIYGLMKQLAFCRPGYSSWRGIKHMPDGGFVDVACVKDVIYAISDLGSLFVIDVDSQAAIDISGRHQYVPPPFSAFPQWDWELLFLIESSGNLCIVFQNFVGKRRRHSIESTKFRIYSYDFNKRQWIKLSHLGNHAVFVADNCSFSICAPDCLNFKSNSIYFVGIRNEERWPSREVHVELGVYSMTNRISEPFRFGPDIPNYLSYPHWVMPTLSLY